MCAFSTVLRATVTTDAFGVSISQQVDLVVEFNWNQNRKTMTSKTASLKSCGSFVAPNEDQDVAHVNEACRRGGANRLER